MSVLIRGMEMPKHGDVLVVREYNGKTYIKHEGHIGFEGRIVEVQEPHGRLIDVDKFKQDHSMGNKCAECEQKQKGTLKSCEYDRIYSKMDFCQWLDDEPTIIEAEGSET